MSDESFESIRSDFETWHLQARWASHGTLANYFQDFEQLAKKLAEGKKYDLNRVVNLEIKPEEDSHVEEDQEIIRLLQTSINRITEKFAKKGTEEQLNVSMLKSHLKHIHQVIKDETDELLSKERASSFDVPGLKDKYVVELRNELRDSHTRSMARFFQKQGETVVKVQRHTGYDDLVELINGVTQETYVVLNNLVFPESRPLTEETKRLRYLTNFITPMKEGQGLSDKVVPMKDDEIKDIVSLDTEDFAQRIKDYKPAKMARPGDDTSLNQAKIRESGSMIFTNVK